VAVVVEHQPVPTVLAAAVLVALYINLFHLRRLQHMQLRSVLEERVE
jgi:hypothetical protein